MTLGVPHGYSSERVMLAQAGIQKAIFERQILLTLPGLSRWRYGSRAGWSGTAG